MPNAAESSPHRARAVARPLIAVALAAGFILVARQIEPSGSLAGEGASLSDPVPQALLPSTPQKTFGSGRPTLGTLTGGDYTIEISPGPDGPRYSVYDKDGTLLADQLPAEDLYRAVPDLDVTTMFSGGPLMMAELPEP